jgi:MFS family permease
MSIGRRQLASLFACNLAAWTVGNGLLPLLPVYAVKLGADPAVTGLYLALSYLAIALGATSAGWVSGSRFRRRVPLIVTGLASVPLPWLMGLASSIWSLTLLTALLWFCGGLGLALMGILAGLSAGEGERGKVFGILAVTGGLGALIGNLGVGWLVRGWGYTTMFTALPVLMLAWPVAAFFLEEKENTKARHDDDAPRAPMPLGRDYLLLCAASTVLSIAGFFILLIRSFQMSDMGFGPLEISSTGAVGGLISMPLPLVMGWLSDRFDRKPLLILAYLSDVGALVLLPLSYALWHFWLVLVLQGVAGGSNSSIGNAWVTDLIPRESYGKGLAVFGATAWVGGAVGFALAGSLLQNLGSAPASVLGGCLALGAVGLLIPMRGGLHPTGQARAKLAGTGRSGGRGGPS